VGYLCDEGRVFRKRLAMTQYLRIGLALVIAAMVITFLRWTPQHAKSTKTSNTDPYTLHMNARLQSMPFDKIEDMAFVFPAARRN
jgi:hypothetical protein